MSHVAEHMEHASGHGHGPGSSSTGKYIGITMAMLGVMLAVSAALVGSHRTKLVQTMVDQSNKWGIYQAETMKFRVMEADLELLKAITPKPDEIKALDATLRAKRASSGRADDEDTAEVKDLIASAVDDLAELLSPDPTEKKRFAALAKKYEVDMKEAKEDAEAFDDAVDAHQEAAEHYEQAQVIAEIGIVIASIALLLSSRKIWGVAVVLGVVCIGVLGMTYVHTSRALVAAEQKIKKAAEETQKIEADDEDDDSTPEGSAGSAESAPPTEKAKAPSPQAPEKKH